MSASEQTIQAVVLGGTGYVRFEDDIAWLIGPVETVFQTEVSAETQ